MWQLVVTDWDVEHNFTNYSNMTAVDGVVRQTREDKSIQLKHAC